VQDRSIRVALASAGRGNSYNNALIWDNHIVCGKLTSGLRINLRFTLLRRERSTAKRTGSVGAIHGHHECEPAGRNPKKGDNYNAKRYTCWYIWEWNL
jgi:hypothetical protein